jgi:hypothetical protein
MNTPGHEPLTPEERAWAQRLEREGPHGEPGPALDARILAAARAAVETPAASRPRHRSRWPVALGLAASVALAVGLAWRLRPLPEPVVYDEAASAATAESAMAVETAPAAADPAARATQPVGAPPPPSATAVPAPPAAQVQVPRARPAAAAEPAVPVVTDEAAQDTLDMVADPPASPAPPVPPAPPTTPALAPTPVGNAARTGAAKAAAAPQTGDAAAAQRRDAAQAEIAEAAAAAADAAGEPEEDVPPATADSPAVREAWLRRIRELQAAGRIDEARASLAEFMHRHPGHPLPDDLKPLAE